MARYAMVDGAGLVVNVVIIEDISQYLAPEGFALIESSVAGVGDTWNGSEFIRPAPPPAPPVVLSATPRQIRLALSAFGLRQAVEDYVNAQPIEVQDNWQYASVFLRDNAIILAGQAALGLTDEQIDGFFQTAMAL